MRLFLGRLPWRGGKWLNMCRKPRLGTESDFNHLDFFVANFFFGVEFYFQKGEVLEELWISKRYWHVRRKKLLPELPLFLGRLPWRRGKWFNMCRNPRLGTENDFNHLVLWSNLCKSLFVFKKTGVLEKLGRFERHWQVGRKKLLPVVNLFLGRLPWRRGKRLNMCWKPRLGTENDFNHFVLR